MNPKIGIIVQARTGSSRLPCKVVQPFVRFSHLSILDILLEKLSKTDLPLVLATTNNPNDDILEQMAIRHQIAYFRGSEENVLSRFVEAAQQYHFDFVVRVCADNPFLSLQLFRALLQKAIDTNFNFDYLSFSFQREPAIKTHFGVFVEIARTAALEKALQTTNEPIYLEHVTNLLYNRSDIFHILLFEIPADLFFSPSIRLTVDTKADFEMAAYLYEEILHQYKHTEIDAINAYLAQRPDLLEKMRVAIAHNEKK